MLTLKNQIKEAWLLKVKQVAIKQANFIKKIIEVKDDETILYR